jgi:hypothetical protein
LHLLHLTRSKVTDKGAKALLDSNRMLVVER